MPNLQSGATAAVQVRRHGEGSWQSSALDFCDLFLTTVTDEPWHWRYEGESAIEQFYGR